MSYNTANQVLSIYSLFLKILFGMKAPHKRGVDAVRAGLLNMSEQEENVGVDCLAHIFGGVIYDSCRHFNNPLSPESERARNMDTEIFRLLSTRLGCMAEELACNKPFMNVSVPI